MMKAEKRARLQKPKVLIAVVVIILIVGATGFLFQRNRFNAQSEANALFSTVLADAPQLSGVVILSKEKDHTLEPVSTSFEPHGGYIKRTVTRVATADQSITNADYEKLVEYMRAKNLDDHRTNKDQTKTFAKSPDDENPISIADVFVIRNLSEINNISFLANNDAELKQTITQHFEQSPQPVYGYVLTVTYLYPPN